MSAHSRVVAALLAADDMDEGYATAYLTIPEFRSSVDGAAALIIAAMPAWLESGKASAGIRAQMELAARTMHPTRADWDRIAVEVAGIKPPAPRIGGGACGAAWSSPEASHPYVCTLPARHVGDHEAGLPGGTIAQVWPR